MDYVSAFLLDSVAHGHKPHLPSLFIIVNSRVSNSLDTLDRIAEFLDKEAQPFQPEIGYDIYQGAPEHIIPPHIDYDITMGGFAVGGRRNAHPNGWENPSRIGEA